jgi:hypothetical protein
MSSYISSFKAVLAALVIIAIAEVSYSAVDTSSAVERSGYLNLNFDSPELFQRAIIYEKLGNAVAARPDVIQIGDSSGFHAIVPRIVDQYLAGRRYENLSCCANIGYDGYYTIVEFMLRNTTSIRAVVLYTSPYSPPNDPEESKTAGTVERLRNAFGWPAPFVSPATLSARARILRPVYTLGDSLQQPGLLPAEAAWPDVIRSMRANGGWWPEHDSHRTGEKHKKMMDAVCTGLRGLVDAPPHYTRDIFAFRQSHLRVELRRLAELTARHQAKLIVLFQPSACPSAPSDYFAARRADLEALVAEYGNLVVPDRTVIEPWPTQWFTGLDHLRTGHEDAASRRVGRAVARALDVAFVEPPYDRSASSEPVPAWSSSDFAAPSWQREGLQLRSPSDGRGVVATETTESGWHRISTVLPDLQPKTQILSVTFRADGPRQIRLEMLDQKQPGAYGDVRCNPADGESWRLGAMLDSGIEELPDRSFRCWGKLRLTKTGVAIAISLARTVHDAGPYPGDGQSSVVLKEVSVSTVDGAPD